MPGYHVVVYSAPLPRYGGDGSLQPPGYLYFVSTSSQQLKDYEVYSQFGPNKFPVPPTSATLSCFRKVLLMLASAIPGWLVPIASARTRAVA